MTVSMRALTRVLGTGAAVLLLVILTLGTGGAALALSPVAGNGNGPAHANSDANASNNARSGATPSSNGNGIPGVPANGHSSKATSSSGGSSAASSKTSVKTATKSTASNHDQGNASTRGDYNKPQPVSNADTNTGGANGGCPGTTKGDYCSTRDGSPSMNGNGGGKAVGKPCAGCVGKADNKNPPGQYKNGSDHNAGYECDRNHGIGRSNPAHTGCKSTTPVTPPVETCPDGSPKPCFTPPGQCVPTTDRPCVTPPPVTCPAGTAQQGNVCVPAAVECPAGTKLQGNHCVKQQPVVAGVETFAPPPPSVKPQVRGVSRIAPATGVLPATGAGDDLGLLGVAGFALVLGGAATLLMRRKVVA